MVISGGEYLEWPSDAHYTEVTMEEYEDWLWEQVLEDGPPQDSDTEWLKNKAWGIGFGEGMSWLSEDKGEAQLVAL